MRIRFFRISPVSHAVNVRKVIISNNDTDHVSTFPKGSGEHRVNMIPMVMQRGITLSLIYRI